MNLHLITGASKGLGKALAEYLADKGDHAIDFSRSGTFDTDKIKSFKLDFAEPDNISDTLKQALSNYDLSQYEMISLTNNAALIQPIKKIEALTAEEIQTSITVNLTSQVIFTAEFLKNTKGISGQKTIVNISSGVAKRPKAYWSVYSATKAALESISGALDLETDFDHQVINFEPGIIDTEMQSEIRNSEFDDVERFKEFKQDGHLLPASKVAEILGRLILKEEGAQASPFVSVRDFFVI